MEWKGIWTYVGNLIPGKARPDKCLEEEEEFLDVPEGEEQGLGAVTRRRRTLVWSQEAGGGVGAAAAEGSCPPGSLTEARGQDETRATSDDDTDDGDQDDEEVVQEEERAQGENDGCEGDQDVDEGALSSSQTSSDFEVSDEVDTEIENNVVEESSLETWGEGLVGGWVSRVCPAATVAPADVGGGGGQASAALTAGGGRREVTTGTEDTDTTAGAEDTDTTAGAVDTDTTGVAEETDTTDSEKETDVTEGAKETDTTVSEERTEVTGGEGEETDATGGEAQTDATGGGEEETESIDSVVEGMDTTSDGGEGTDGEGTDSTGSEATDATGSEATEATVSEATDPTGSEATEATGSEATEATGSEATDATGSEATDPTGSEATDATGSEATDATGSEATDATGSEATDATGSVEEGTDTGGEEETDITGDGDEGTDTNDSDGEITDATGDRVRKETTSVGGERTDTTTDGEGTETIGRGEGTGTTSVGREEKDAIVGGKGTKTISGGEETDTADSGGEETGTTSGGEGTDAAGGDGKGSDTAGSDGKGTDTAGGDGKGTDSAGSGGEGTDTAGEDGEGTDTTGRDGEDTDTISSGLERTDTAGGDGEETDTTDDGGEGTDTTDGGGEGTDTAGGGGEGKDTVGGDEEGMSTTDGVTAGTEVTGGEEGGEQEPRLPSGVENTGYGSRKAVSWERDGSPGADTEEPSGPGVGCATEEGIKEVQCPYILLSWRLPPGTAYLGYGLSKGIENEDISMGKDAQGGVSEATSGVDEEANKGREVEIRPTTVYEESDDQYRKEDAEEDGPGAKDPKHFLRKESEEKAPATEAVGGDVAEDEQRDRGDNERRVDKLTENEKCDIEEKGIGERNRQETHESHVQTEGRPRGGYFGTRRVFLRKDEPLRRAEGFTVDGFHRYCEDVEAASKENLELMMKAAVGEVSQPKEKERLGQDAGGLLPTFLDWAEAGQPGGGAVGDGTHDKNANIENKDDEKREDYGSGDGLVRDMQASFEPSLADNSLLSAARGQLDTDTLHEPEDDTRIQFDVQKTREDPCDKDKIYLVRHSLDSGGTSEGRTTRLETPWDTQPKKQTMVAQFSDVAKQIMKEVQDSRSRKNKCLRDLRSLKPRTRFSMSKKYKDKSSPVGWTKPPFSRDHDEGAERRVRPEPDPPLQVGSHGTEISLSSSKSKIPTPERSPPPTTESDAGGSISSSIEFYEAFQKLQPVQVSPNFSSPTRRFRRSVEVLEDTRKMTEDVPEVPTVVTSHLWLADIGASRPQQTREGRSITTETKENRGELSLTRRSVTDQVLVPLTSETVHVDSVEIDSRASPVVLQVPEEPPGCGSITPSTVVAGEARKPDSRDPKRVEGGGQHQYSAETGRVRVLSSRAARLPQLGDESKQTSDGLREVVDDTGDPVRGSSDGRDDNTKDKEEVEDDNTVVVRDSGTARLVAEEGKDINSAAQEASRGKEQTTHSPSYSKVYEASAVIFTPDSVHSSVLSADDIARTTQTQSSPGKAPATPNGVDSTPEILDNAANENRENRNKPLRWREEGADGSHGTNNREINVSIRTRFSGELKTSVSNSSSEDGDLENLEGPWTSPQLARVVQELVVSKKFNMTSAQAKKRQNNISRLDVPQKDRTLIFDSSKLSKTKSEKSEGLSQLGAHEDKRTSQTQEEALRGVTKGVPRKSSRRGGRGMDYSGPGKLSRKKRETNGQAADGRNPEASDKRTNSGNDSPPTDSEVAPGNGALAAREFQRPFTKHSSDRGSKGDSKRGSGPREKHLKSSTESRRTEVVRGSSESRLRSASKVERPCRSPQPQRGRSVGGLAREVSPRQSPVIPRRQISPRASPQLGSPRLGPPRAVSPKIATKRLSPKLDSPKSGGSPRTSPTARSPKLGSPRIVKPVVIQGRRSPRLSPGPDQHRTSPDHQDMTGMISLSDVLPAREENDFEITAGVAEVKIVVNGHSPESLRKMRETGTPSEEVTAWSGVEIDFPESKMDYLTVEGTPQTENVAGPFDDGGKSQSSEGEDLREATEGSETPASESVQPLMGLQRQTSDPLQSFDTFMEKKASQDHHQQRYVYMASKISGKLDSEIIQFFESQQQRPREIARNEKVIPEHFRGSSRTSTRKSSLQPYLEKTMSPRDNRSGAEETRHFENLFELKKSSTSVDLRLKKDDASEEVVQDKKEDSVKSESENVAQDIEILNKTEDSSVFCGFPTGWKDKTWGSEDLVESELSMGRRGQGVEVGGEEEGQVESSVTTAASYGRASQPEGPSDQAGAVGVIPDDGNSRSNGVMDPKTGGEERYVATQHVTRDWKTKSEKTEAEVRMAEKTREHYVPEAPRSSRESPSSSTDRRDEMIARFKQDDGMMIEKIRSLKGSSTRHEKQVDVAAARLDEQAREKICVGLRLSLAESQSDETEHEETRGDRERDGSQLEPQEVSQFFETEEDKLPSVKDAILGQKSMSEEDGKMDDSVVECLEKIREGQLATGRIAVVRDARSSPRPGTGPATLSGSRETNMQGDLPGEVTSWSSRECVTESRVRLDPQDTSSLAELTVSDADRLILLSTDHPPTDPSTDPGFVDPSIDHALTDRSTDDVLVDLSADTLHTDLQTDRVLTNPSIDHTQVHVTTDPGLVATSTDPGLVRTSTDPDLVDTRTDPSLVDSSIDHIPSIDLGFEDTNTDLGLVDTNTDVSLVDTSTDLGLVEAITDPALADRSSDSTLTDPGTDQFLAEAELGASRTQATEAPLGETEASLAADDDEGKTSVQTAETEHDSELKQREASLTSLVTDASEMKEVKKYAKESLTVQLTLVKSNVEVRDKGNNSTPEIRRSIIVTDSNAGSTDTLTGEETEGTSGKDEDLRKKVCEDVSDADGDRGTPDDTGTGSIWPESCTDGDNVNMRSDSLLLPGAVQSSEAPVVASDDGRELCGEQELSSDGRELGSTADISTDVPSESREQQGDMSDDRDRNTTTRRLMSGHRRLTKTISEGNFSQADEDGPDSQEKLAKLPTPPSLQRSQTEGDFHPDTLVAAASSISRSSTVSEIFARGVYGRIRMKSRSVENIRLSSLSTVEITSAIDTPPPPRAGASPCRIVGVLKKKDSKDSVTGPTVTSSSHSQQALHEGGTTDNQDLRKDHSHVSKTDQKPGDQTDESSEAGATNQPTQPLESLGKDCTILTTEAVKGKLSVVDASVMETHIYENVPQVMFRRSIGDLKVASQQAEAEEEHSLSAAELRKLVPKVVHIYENLQAAAVAGTTPTPSVAAGGVKEPQQVQEDVAAKEITPGKGLSDREEPADVKDSPVPTSQSAGELSIPKRLTYEKSSLRRRQQPESESRTEKQKSNYMKQKTARVGILKKQKSDITGVRLQKLHYFDNELPGERRRSYSISGGVSKKSPVPQRVISEAEKGSGVAVKQVSHSSEPATKVDSSEVDRRCHSSISASSGTSRSSRIDRILQSCAPCISSNTTSTLDLSAASSDHANGSRGDAAQRGRDADDAVFSDSVPYVVHGSLSRRQQARTRYPYKTSYSTSDVTAVLSSESSSSMARDPPVEGLSVLKDSSKDLTVKSGHTEPKDAAKEAEQESERTQAPVSEQSSSSLVSNPVADCATTVTPSDTYYTGDEATISSEQTGETSYVSFEKESSTPTPEQGCNGKDDTDFYSELLDTILSVVDAQEPSFSAEAEAPCPASSVAPEPQVQTQQHSTDQETSQTRVEELPQQDPADQPIECTTEQEPVSLAKDCLDHPVGTSDSDSTSSVDSELAEVRRRVSERFPPAPRADPQASQESVIASPSAVCPMPNCAACRSHSINFSQPLVFTFDEPVTSAMAVCEPARAASLPYVDHTHDRAVHDLLSRSASLPHEAEVYHSTQGVCRTDDDEYWSVREEDAGRGNAKLHGPKRPCQSSSLHDASPRDLTLLDSSQKDSSSQETSPKDSTSQESSPKDSTSQDSSPKDSTSQDSSPKDSTSQDSSPKNSMSQDSSSKDSSSQEASPKDPSSQEVSPKDSLPQDSPQDGMSQEDPQTDSGLECCRDHSESSSNQLVEELSQLRLENEKLSARNRSLQSEVEELRRVKENIAEEDLQLKPRINEMTIELTHAKEALSALKADRKRLKAEKFDLLNQMKQLYATLEDKEKELRDFIRNYEQRMKESDESLRHLAAERDETEREKWNILKHARDESERVVKLSAQLGLKEATVKRLQEELDMVRKQLTSVGYYSDAESVRTNGLTTPTASTPACSPLPVSTPTPTPNGRGSSADSGVRLSSDRDSTASHDGTLTITVERGSLDCDTLSVCSSATAVSQYYYYACGPGTPKESPSLSPLYATPVSLKGEDQGGEHNTPSGAPTPTAASINSSAISGLANSSASTGGLSRSAEQLCERLSEAAESSKLRGSFTLSRKSHKGGGTWGSISRVFARQKKRAALDASLYDGNGSDKRASWSPSSSLCASPLTEESYSEKLRLLEEAQHIPLERWKAPTVLAWLEVTLGMPQYGAMCAENVRSGKVLLELSDSELEAGLGITHPMHRKKLRLAIEELREPRLTRFPRISTLGHTWVSSEWLPDLGLPQYSETFANNLVDGRLLEALTKKELEKHLGVHRKFHQASVIHGVHLLRIVRFDRQVLAERRRQSDHIDTDPVVWTNMRWIRWARSIDLAEYADNLKDSGVHGALVVLESSFTADTMATALGIPQSKNIIRRHLATELESLVNPARQQLDEQARYAKMERRRQEKLASGGSLGRSFSRSYGTGLEKGEKDKRRSSLRGSLSRALGLRLREETATGGNNGGESSSSGGQSPAVTTRTHAHHAPHARPRSSIMPSAAYVHHETHRRVKSIGDIETITVTPV